MANTATAFHASICGYLDGSATLNLRRESFFFQVTQEPSPRSMSAKKILPPSHPPLRFPPPSAPAHSHAASSKNFPPNRDVQIVNSNDIFSVDETCLRPPPLHRLPCHAPLATLFTFLLLLQSVPIRLGRNISRLTSFTRGRSSRSTPFGIETRRATVTLTDRSSRLRTQHPGKSNQL